ncbi:hypothetical protein FRC08_006567 [Ceratobasidium sp. 394]|nr:hypothetical protein FRC08_006567 [Ceratobasidium sp. 394]
MESCTKQAQLTDLFVVDQKPVIIVDFPGFDDTLMSNADLLAHIVGFLVFLHKSKVKITGMLYLHPISHNRFQGSDARNFHLFREICGPSAFQNVVFVTTMWSKPPAHREESREQWLRDSELAFRDILGAGAQLARHTDETRESALRILRLVLNKNPVVPHVSCQSVDEGKHLEETDAGKALGREFQDHIRKTREEIEQLKAQQNEAQEKLRGELQGAIHKAEQERKDLEAKLKTMQEKHDKEVKDREAERRKFQEEHGEECCIIA